MYISSDVRWRNVRKTQGERGGERGGIRERNISVVILCDIKCDVMCDIMYYFDCDIKFDIMCYFKCGIKCYFKWVMKCYFKCGIRFDIIVRTLTDVWQREMLIICWPSITVYLVLFKPVRHSKEQYYVNIGFLVYLNKQNSGICFVEPLYSRQTN